MGWKRFLSFTMIFALLAAMTAGAAYAHEGHRQREATVAETPGTAAPAAEEAGEELAPKADVSPAREPELPATTESVSRLAWPGRLHPMLIHFPIALFIAALLAELLYAATRREQFRHALRFCLWIAAPSACLAAPLGWLFAASGETEAGWVLEAHRWTGTFAALLGIAVLWLGERSERRAGGRVLLRVSLGLETLLIGVVGFLGGSLLYGIDHLWRGF